MGLEPAAVKIERAHSLLLCLCRVARACLPVCLGAHSTMPFCPDANCRVRVRHRKTRIRKKLYSQVAGSGGLYGPERNTTSTGSNISRKKHLRGPVVLAIKLKYLSFHSHGSQTGPCTRPFIRSRTHPTPAWRTFVKTATPTPVPALAKTSTSSLFRLKYWLSMRDDVSRTIALPTPNRMP